MFVRERSLLKSALYSQLDLLDTNDAIVHLNQLESCLAEQVRVPSVAVFVVEPFLKMVSSYIMPYNYLNKTTQNTERRNGEKEIHVRRTQESWEENMPATMGLNRFKHLPGILLEKHA